MTIEIFTGFVRDLQQGDIIIIKSCLYTVRNTNLQDKKYIVVLDNYEGKTIVKKWKESLYIKDFSDIK